MRIAVNTRFLLPGKLEGIGWYTHEVLSRLVQSYPEIEWLFLFDRPFDERFIYGKNVKGIVVPPPARHPVLWYLWLEWSLPWVLRKHKADLFYSPDGFCSLRTRVPTVMVCHDIAWQHFPKSIPASVFAYYNHFVPKYLRKAESILAVSKFTKQDIIKHCSISPEKITVAPNGVRDHFKNIEEGSEDAIRSKVAGGAPFFWSLGAMHPRKNIPRLIEAFFQFKAESGAPHHLVLGGRMAWDTGEIFNVLQKSQAYKDQVHFLGYVPDEQLPSITAAAAASVCVSLWEGFGVPALEGLTCGVPVIASSNSSLAEVVGEAGFLVDPMNVHEMAAKFQHVAMLTDLERKAIGLLGKKQAENFSWDLTAKITGSVLLDHLQEKH